MFCGKTKIYCNDGNDTAKYCIKRKQATTNEPEPDILSSEVEEAIRHLKSNKAPGTEDMQASRILLRIIYRRLQKYMLPQMPPEQAGFVKGRGTKDQIFNTRQLIEKAREFNVPMLCRLQESLRLCKMGESVESAE